MTTRYVMYLRSVYFNHSSILFAEGRRLSWPVMSEPVTFQLEVP